ncbi:MAG: LysR family transcriptional regulator [Myxococcales bacterium]|nr:LysR family transcriptional regulator [Myxococcales bacterium]
MDHRRLAGLDLNLLLLLDALLEEKSVTRAGARVGASQPAVSRGLARLREALEDPILVRSGRAMLLTPKAAALAPSLRRALRELGSIFDGSASFDPASCTRTFTLAAPEYVERVLIAPLIAALRDEAPHASWVVRAATLSVVPMAETGDVDLGVVATGTEAPGLLRRLLWTDGYTLVRQARFASKKSVVSETEYAALDHVVVSPDGRGPSAVDLALASLGLERNVVARVASLAGAVELARRSLCALTIPTRLAAVTGVLSSDLATAPLPFLPPLPVYAMRHERFAQDAAIAWLYDRVCEAAAALN